MPIPEKIIREIFFPQQSDRGTHLRPGAVACLRLAIAFAAKAAKVRKEALLRNPRDVRLIADR